MARKKRGKPTGSHSWVTALTGPGRSRNRPEAVTRWLLLQKCLIRKVGSLLYCHSIASFPGSCIIGNAAKSKTRRKEIRAGKCQVDLLPRWGREHRQVQLSPKPPASSPSPTTENLLRLLAREFLPSLLFALCWGCGLPSRSHSGGLLCSLFNEQNPWKRC